MTTKTMHHSRLFLPALAAAFLLSGCMNRVESMKETLAFAWSGNQDITVTPEQLAQISYPMMYARFNQQRRIALGLGFDDNDHYKWLSGDQEVVVTRHGRVVQTQGVTGDLNELAWVSNLSNDPLKCLTQTNTQQSSQCSLTWRAQVQSGVAQQASTETITSQFTRVGSESLELPMNRTMNTVHWREHISQDNGVTWTNDYWLSTETGRVVKSSQQLSKALPRVVTEELKPYKKDVQKQGHTKRGAN
ncbi:group 4 capsule polysaccharide lipoprotein GfcB/YjbF [Idiomarina fontislapidosi]|uniref:YjbF family lipoprotein n=1 Tax=Idiomarina fontislapidosi TaxID=263723 RepID=A0A432XQX1_9GAMM|nr:YjbF family lipoprotein [Idiomarina fontislapidosi]PYE30703.1 group 4 capsule polysaccharide lipoprotein GfcB/YjbF [Idiomarina fontislapidosi]RUO51129.1 hypothetical protein CWE25_12025 [Idiomarina fontislapidosi]